MFYSNEVLTSRKYGVATVWLVATMGTKSGLKKVGKKAILDVDVAKACSTVLAPEAPMALRLQSNLLFGIARVYAQQCGYILTDAESARNNMLAMLKRRNQADMLQPEGQARPKADVLEDDPAFIPGLDFMNNMDLGNLNFGRLNLDSTTLQDDLQSTLSPHSSQMTDASQQSIAGLMLPPSASSLPGGAVGGNDLFGIRGDSGSGTVRPTRMLEDDLFIVGDDGTMNFDDVPIRQSQAHSSVAKDKPFSERRDRLSESVGVNMSDHAPDDGFLPLQDDFEPARPESELQHETSSETAAAPLRRKRVQKVHIVPIDITTELSNRELSERNQTYLADMRAASHQKQATKMVALAKKNAEYWVLGAGDFLGLGQGICGPLEMFSGARLFEAFTGVDVLNAGKKRAREAGDEDASTQTGRRVRSREEAPVDEIGRGISDDNFFSMGDDTIEQGREAPTPLDERQASSIFPWNQSAGSRRPTDGHATSASMGPIQLDKPLRRVSRLTSASPLTGRGMVGGEPDDLQLGLESNYAMGGMTGYEEFELFGVAAQVDTQTADQSQWQRATLIGESANFLDFVRTAIESADQNRMADEGDDAVSGSIDFETLLPPHQSQIVAAQAFLHVLTLGSRQMIQVDQKEAFGAISMRMIAV